MSGIGAAFAALNIGAKLTGISGVLKKVPPKVWYGLALAAALLVGFLWHQHAAHKALKAQYTAGYAQAGKDIAAHALKLKAKIDAMTVKIAADERSKNDAENRRISAAADALRLRGPGKAGCTLRSEPAAAAGGHEPSGRASDVAVAGLPDPTGIDLIGVPFDDAVDFGKSHDAWRAEALSWRSFWARLVAAWPKAGP